MLGLGTARQQLDDPTAKALAGSLTTRIVDYLIKNRWCAMTHDGKSVSAPFGQSPTKVHGFTLLALQVDPRFQATWDEVKPLAHMVWVSDWVGLLDPLSQYYKWNLGYTMTYHSMRLETDPARFASLQRAHDMERRLLATHDNAYFEAVDAAVDPRLVAMLAPRIQDGMNRMGARPQRYVARNHSADPAIAKDWYEVPLSVQKQAGTLAPKKELMAKYALPIEVRCSTDYLWQRNPFQLDGGGDPREQSPGVDVVLPYWLARFYKLAK